MRQTSAIQPSLLVNEKGEHRWGVAILELTLPPLDPMLEHATCRTVRSVAPGPETKKPGNLPGLDDQVVETRRIELPTFALRTRRSPS